MSIWGADQGGSAIFRKVRNPDYIRATGTFKVYIAADDDFDQLIAYQEGGLGLGVDAY